MKTIKEGIHHCVRCLKYLSNYPPYEPVSVEYGFIQGVAFAEEWISVKDELPEDRTRIVFEDFAGINTISGVYEKTTNTVRSKYLTVSFDIAIHWRPINRK